MQKTVCFLFILACAAAHAASFDCAKAATPQEKAICANPQLSAADDRMAAAYRKALASAPKGLHDEIRDGQRAWIRRVTLDCLPDNPYNPLDKCLGNAYAARTEELGHPVTREGGIQFAWHHVSFTVPDTGELGDDDRRRGVSPVTLFDARWPQALAETPEWQAWNAAMEDAARDMASQGNAGADKKCRPQESLDTDLHTELGVVTPQLVTATVTNLWYGHGAAHPNTATIQFNWLLREKRELGPEDVFRADSGWKKALYEKTDKYLHEQLDGEAGGDYQNESAPGTIATTLNKIVENPGNWQIDEKGIAIAFPEYAVACRACTPEPFSMTWGDLKALMKPTFIIPEE
jgi:uncharacterized protein YecT (DUF1311 family)